MLLGESGDLFLQALLTLCRDDHQFALFYCSIADDIFADPGMQSIDVDTEIFDRLRNRLIWFVSRLAHRG